jgi:hypothetical protein
MYVPWKDIYLFIKTKSSSLNIYWYTHLVTYMYCKQTIEIMGFIVFMFCSGMKVSQIFLEVTQICRLYHLYM